jgi:hypothetical protein
VVRGLWVPESPFEWAILGGTGELTLAQGIVYGKTVHHDPNKVIMTVSSNFASMYSIAQSTNPIRL